MTDMKKIILLTLFFISVFTSQAQIMKSHTIARGETIESIAKKYGITVEELKKANPTLEKLQYVGMTLKIPAKSGAIESSAKTTTSTVVSNEKESELLASSIVHDSYTYARGEKGMLDPANYNFFGINYTTPFDGIDSGFAGFVGNIFGSKGFGGTFAGGWQFKNFKYGGGAVRFGAGPNYCYPISEHVFVYSPLCLDLYGTIDENDKWHFNVGIELLPSLGLKYGKFFVTGGFWLGWFKGVKKIYPGFNVSLAYEI